MSLSDCIIFGKKPKDRFYNSFKSVSSTFGVKILKMYLPVNGPSLPCSKIRFPYRKRFLSLLPFHVSLFIFTKT